MKGNSMAVPIERILENVQKPGRYTGGETNTVVKDQAPSALSVAIAYPDTYEIGMSYLGLRILYHLLNDMPDVVCERVFAPWVDMEERLRKYGRKLFSLESGRDLCRFDVIGFSLSYELTYTNVLNMLDMGGVPVLASRREDSDPLVIAGGACCFNPEPMSDFIDVFFIGDAEETLPDFLRHYRELRREHRLSRHESLKRLAGMKGIYIPAFYREAEGPDGAGGMEPVMDGVPRRVEKASVPDLDKAYYPVEQIVPLVRTVHDRIAVEIMRGCPNKCRFCQASAINRPVRTRSVETVRQLCRRTYSATGYESIALLSLSSVNYPWLSELVKGLNSDFRKKGVALSIPSLRVDEAFYEMPEMLSVIKKGGLTFAPESADGDIRKAIGKDIDIEVLCRSSFLAYKHGWRSLKLYFMVGFPGDPGKEAERIISLSRELSGLRRQAAGGAAEIKVSVNPFIPKPHTPFQWLGMKAPSGLQEVRKALLDNSSRRIKISFNDISGSVLEACMSRGSRKTGSVIYRAWKKGARMDSWSEHFDIHIWERSFSEEGMDMYREACKRFDPDDVLPWSHIAAAGDPEALKKELFESGYADAL
jgi:radical SAM family uncharacterized protein